MQAADAVLVVVRFADTLLDVRHVARGASYRIGTARDVDLAIDIAPLTSFPLVGWVGTTGVCRVPAGIVARSRTDRVHGGQLELARGNPVALAIGALAIEVELVPAPVRALVRPRFDRRPAWYVAACLVAHVALWAIAMWRAPIEPLAIAGFESARDRRTTRIARFDRVVRRGDAPSTQRPTPLAATPPPGTPEPPKTARISPPGRRTDRGQGARDAGVLASGKLGDWSAIIGKADLAAELAKGGSTLYDPESATLGNFGNARGFDPTASPAFDTVKSGRYATQATGRSAGEQYDLPGSGTRDPTIVTVTCGSSSCAVIGGQNGSEIRRALERRLPDIVACYERLAPDQDTERHVEMDFALDDAGKVDRVKMASQGVVESCIANIVASIEVEHARTPPR
ncbi:MAG TPA: hypothetical protein VFQ53_06850 [Kofleriaceae bacterium]|nr:hypothetical protein [Kofleriaceae bacterium]